MKKIFLIAIIFLCIFQVKGQNLMQEIMLNQRKIVLNQIGTVTTPVEGVSFQSVNTNLDLGNSLQLTTVFDPSNSTDKTGVWASSSTGVATVNQSGLVTSVAEGSTSITFTSTDGSFVATVDVDVIDEPLPAFPTAYGAGAYATGGRGGDVYHVTNLNDSGTGSFRDAVSQGNRTVVFDVSGIIELQGNLYIDESNLTIAGQSAPEGGITITPRVGGNIGFEYKICENNIMRYVRIRSNFNGGRNAFRVYPSSANDTRFSRNHIFDHISISYSGLQAFSIGGLDTHNITFQNGLLAESKTGVLFGDTNPSQTGFSYNNTFKTTLFYNISHRTPNVASQGTDVYNNVSYDWNNRMSVVVNGARVNHFNNYYYTGFIRNSLTGGTYNDLPQWRVNAGTNNNPSVPFLIWTEGNIVEDLFTNPNANNEDTLWIEHASSSQTLRLDSSFFTDTQFEMQGRVPSEIMTAVESSTAVPNNAGAYKYLNADGSWGVYRDSQDTKYVTNTLNDAEEEWSCCNSGDDNNRHSAIESQQYEDFLNSITGTPINTRPANFYSSNPHIPEVWFNANVPNGEDHNDIAPSGYTWLEEYLNQVDN